MNLLSFGCSFIYGSELIDRDATWPGLIARTLGIEHHNHGIEGAGNLRIMESILTHASRDDICVINWTWIDRFDFVTIENEQWHSIVPSDRGDPADFYYRNMYSQYRDMLTNLAYIKTALDYLRDIGCRYLMTYMDTLLFELVRDDWHDSRAVTYLQQQIRPYTVLFENQTFLQWSRANGYAESALWHPLEEAHAKASELMLPQVRSLL